VGAALTTWYVAAFGFTLQPLLGPLLR